MRLGWILLCLVSLTTVSEAARVTLSWTNPTTLVDDRPLVDLAGLRVSYGTTPGLYTTATDIDVATSVVLDGLTPGLEYVFAVQARRANGVLSAYSAEVRHVIAEESLDRLPPVVQITAPLDGQPVQRKRWMTIRVTAADDGELVGLSIAVNGQILCVAAASPAACDWQVPPAHQTHTILAEAWDQAGNHGWSAPVHVDAR